MKNFTITVLVLAGTLAFPIALFGAGSSEVQQESRQYIPEEKNKMMNDEKMEEIVLAGGCFWCMEAVFEKIPGVRTVTSGYTGGSVENPDYRQVCTGTTGHAEAVKITYNPEEVSLLEILNLFWRAHDPTTLNRQGADRGTQYRSAIFYSDEEQRTLAEESRRKAAYAFRDPIVTEITPLGEFYPAEEYHQDYYEKNPAAGYCQVVIAPKLKKLDL